MRRNRQQEYHHHKIVQPIVQSDYLPESDKKLGRLIFPVTEGHRSPQTASKYRVNFNRFLDYIGSQWGHMDTLPDMGVQVFD